MSSSLFFESFYLRKQEIFMLNPNLFFFNVLGQTLIGLTKLSRNFRLGASRKGRKNL